MKFFKDIDYCPICDEDTEQEIVDSEHERDSSQDSQKCLKCGAKYSGFTGKWEAE
jgi:transcriptional regulator NrdR family protein